MSLIPSRLERSHLATAAIFFGFIALAVLAILFPALVHAQDAVASPDDLSVLLALGAKALAATGVAKWIGLSLLGVLGTVWGVRRIAKGRTSKWARWVLSDEGGTILGYVASAGGALAVHVVGGGKLSVGELGAVALGLRAGTALTWSDGRRILRALLPVLKPLLGKVPGLGGPLVGLLSALSGETAKAEIAAATAAAYKAQDPAPDAQAAAKILGAPPVP